MFDHPHISRVFPLRLTFFPLFCLFAVVIMACGTNDAVECIPGTERAASEKISISPDEKWLVFWEWVVTAAEQYVDGRGEFSMSMASLDMTDGTLIKHELTGLPKKHGIVPFDWVKIELRFDPAGWHSGKFYIDMYPLPYLTVDPTSTTMILGRAPEGLTCSDCPPNEIFNETLKKNTTGTLDRKRIDVGFL